MSMCIVIGIAFGGLIEKKKEMSRWQKKARMDKKLKDHNWRNSGKQGWPNET